MTMKAKKFIPSLLVLALIATLVSAAIGGYRKYPTTTPTQPSAQTVSHVGPKFIIGCFEQPTYNFKDLKILGINTLVGIPMNHPPVPWAEEATADGMYQIRPKVGVPRLDENNPLWIGWEIHDEPDLWATPQSEVDTISSQAHVIGIPVFVNFDGSRLLGLQAPVFGAGASYQSIISKCDWLCSDIYPVSGWNRNIQLQAVGHATDNLRVLGGDSGKEYFQYVECCQQDKWPGPTVAETQTIIRQGERRHLRGMILFSINWNYKWGGEPGKPNAFFGVDDEHREAIAEWADTHSN